MSGCRRERTAKDGRAGPPRSRMRSVAAVGPAEGPPTDRRAGPQRAEEGEASRGGLGYNGISVDREVDRIMASVAWLYLIPLVVFVVVGVLVVSTLRSSGLGMMSRPVRCPNCITPISLRRRPMFRSPMLLGGWMCPHCRTQMDKWGRDVSGMAS